MQELIFRIWDKENKKFLCFSQENKTAWFHTREINENEAHVFLSPFSHIEISLFTGFYDKNENPIFEGDIIRVFPCYESEGLFIADHGIACYLYRREHTEKLRDIHERCTIIGNIYEDIEKYKNLTTPKGDK